MNLQERLHQFVGELPERRATAAAERSVVHLRQLGDDPVGRLAALGGEDAAVGHWQIKRDGCRRGIVEVVGNAEE